MAKKSKINIEESQKIVRISVEMRCRMIMMDTESQFSQYEPWLNLKAKELDYLGYPEIKVEDLWNYLVKFCWKRKQPEHYHACVQQIMAIQPNHYLDFASLEAQVKVSSLEEMDLNAFF